MFFWIAVAAGVLMALLGLRRGWFESMALLFNLLMGVYLGLYVTPMVATSIPAALAVPYGMTITTIGVAVIGFGILQTITYLFITGQFSVPFPRFLDLPGGGLCGFLAGFLVLSFVALIIDIQSHPEGAAPLLSKAVQVNAQYLEWWTDQVNRIAGKDDTSLEQPLTELKALIEPPRTDTITAPEANTPPE